MGGRGDRVVILAKRHVSDAAIVQDLRDVGSVDVAPRICLARRNGVGRAGWAVLHAAGTTACTEPRVAEQCHRRHLSSCSNRVAVCGVAIGYI